MNLPYKFRTPHSELRTGFTLIEMLMVITIIGILAGLIVGTSAIASAHRAKALAESQREALITAIESYHKAKGFYPPDNTNDVNLVQNALFYELTGTMTIFSGNPPTVASFYSPVSSDNLTPSQLNTLFNTSAFMNNSNSSENVSVNFYPGLKANQHEVVTGSGGYNYTVLGIGAAGPLMLSPATGSGGTFSINPWHYNASHPTNNADSYDLWIDVKYSGKTNRICNWSKDPLLVNY